MSDTADQVTEPEAEQPSDGDGQAEPSTELELAAAAAPANWTPPAGHITLELLQLVDYQARMLADSDIIPSEYHRKPANIVAAGITGAAFGWDVMTAMRNGHVIERKYSLGAEAMAALVRKAGHQISGETSPTGAKVTGKRRDTGETMTVSFSLDDAARAKLTGKDNWQKYPQAMCWARAISMLCRMLFPDVLMGLSYTPDELGATTDESGAPLDVPSWEPDTSYSSTMQPGTSGTPQDAPGDPERIAELYEAVQALPDGLREELQDRWKNSEHLAGFSLRAGSKQPVPRKHMGRVRSMVNSYWAKARDLGVDKATAIAAYRELQTAQAAQEPDAQTPQDDPVASTPAAEAPQAQEDDPGGAPGDADVEDAVVVGDDGQPMEERDWMPIMAGLAATVTAAGREYTPDLRAAIEQEVSALHWTAVNRLLAFYGEADNYPPDSPIQLRRMAVQLLAYEPGSVQALVDDMDTHDTQETTTDG